MLTSPPPSDPQIAGDHSVRLEWSVELLRGLAALMVVVAHYHPLVSTVPGLWRFAFTGVDLFFVLSGFVFAPYLAGRPLALWSHLVRRFFRLYPLYLVALAAYVGLRLWQGQPAEYVALHMLFLHTLESVQVAFYYNPAFWSLPPEVEFYLVLPLLALLVRRPPQLILLLLAALALHLALVAASSPPLAKDLNAASIAGYHLPGVLVEFVLGAGAWVVVRRGPGHGARVLLVGAGGGLWLGLALLYLAIAGQGGDAAINAIPVLKGNMSMFAALAFALFMAGWVGWVRKPWRWLRVLGTGLGHLSYGMYLFHNAMPLLLENWFQGWTLMVCSALATVLVAAVLHRWLEAPLRDYGRALALRLR